MLYVLLSLIVAFLFPNFQSSGLVNITFHLVQIQLLSSCFFNQHVSCPIMINCIYVLYPVPVVPACGRVLNSCLIQQSYYAANRLDARIPVSWDVTLRHVCSKRRKPLTRRRSVTKNRNPRIYRCKKKSKFYRVF
jgi:hypothetical protein